MKKKIVHVLYSDKFSGAENVAISIIDGLKDEYDFYYISRKGHISEQLKLKGIKYIPIKKFNIVQLLKIFIKLKPDVIHAHDFRASIISLFTLYPAIKISHIHQSPTWLKSINIFSLLFFLTAIVFKRVIVVSNDIMNSFVFKKLVEKKLTLIPNSIDAENVKSKANEFAIQSDIIFVGRLTDVKNPLRFLEVVRKLYSKKPDLRVVMVGDGDLKHSCHHFVQMHEMENVVHFVSQTTNPFKYIQNSKLLIITSKSEGLPMVVIESLILNKPVISTPVGDLEDVTSNNICYSDEDFIERIYTLLENEEVYSAESKLAHLKSIDFSAFEKYLGQFRREYT